MKQSYSFTDQFKNTLCSLKKRSSLITRTSFLVLYLFLGFQLKAQTTIVSNDFEICQDGYTEFGSYTDGSADYFIRANGIVQDTMCTAATTSSQLTFTNISGYYYTGEDTDRPLENPNTSGEFGSQPLSSGVHFSAIDVSGYTDVKLKLNVAARANLTFEPDLEYLKIYADSKNTGAWALIGAFEVQSSVSSDTLAVDTDLDGIGDGIKLKEEFQTFTFDVPSGATTMNVRIEMNSSSGNEEIAFDTFVLEGTAAATDTTAPVITVCASTPSNISANASCQGTAPNLTGGVTATDDSGVTPTITQSPASGATLGLGTTTITLTATDGSGNTATCTVNQTVVDTTAPVITVCASTPSNISANGSCQGTAPNLTGSVTASDNCTSSPTITQSPASGATLGLGTTTITLTATDGSGNTATCTVNQTVVDTTAPVITVCASTPSNISANGSCQGTAPNLIGSVTASDNCT
ncbi:MAG: HYR domain-containing protein, partial [Algibacter sp.]